ncbi:MAG: hypothetical protein KDA78_08715 [Planctomycetaceae bacterium]|nr:hypothetical protein [Planctomycetaceae bacterium]
MLFRGWYHACQLAEISFPLIVVGIFLPTSWHVSEIGICMIIPIGLVGAVLGIIWTITGIRSACPLCSTPGYWVVPAKRYLAMDCPDCGLVGGCVHRDLHPRTLSEFTDDESSLNNDLKSIP